jgi:hypothetical protein
MQGALDRAAVKTATEAAAIAARAAAAKADADAAALSTPKSTGPVSRFNLGSGFGGGGGGSGKGGDRYDHEYVKSDRGGDAKRRKINKKLDYEAWKEAILAGAAAKDKA